MTYSPEDVNDGTLLDPEVFSRYMIRDSREVLQIMQTLVTKRVLITAYLDDGSAMITAILAVDKEAGSLILDASPDEAMNERAVRSRSLTCTTRLDRIRLQFTAAGAERFPHDGVLALRVPAPEGVLRLQRREFFRLATPVSAPLLCNITVGDGSGNKRSVPVKVLDISSGGMAIIVPPAGLELTPGMEFGDCRLTLPEGEPLQMRVVIRNLFHVDRQNGVRVLRAGCEFIGLPNSLNARIQRYIFKVERDRKARESGF